MKNAVAVYRRAVRRRLHCAPADKRRLMDMLDQMLQPLLEDYPAPGTDILNVSLGRPEAMAADLLAELPAKRVKRWKYICRGVIAALILVLFAILIYHAAMKPNKLVAKGGETIAINPIGANNE